jgi:hypothetical protein
MFEQTQQSDFLELLHTSRSSISALAVDESQVIISHDDFRRLAPIILWLNDLQSQKVQIPIRLVSGTLSAASVRLITRSSFCHSPLPSIHGLEIPQYDMRGKLDSRKFDTFDQMLSDLVFELRNYFIKHSRAQVFSLVSYVLFIIPITDHFSKQIRKSTFYFVKIDLIGFILYEI